MKKLLIMMTVATATIAFTACGNNANSEAPKGDSSASVTHPPDNSSATNPSLADTAYSSDSTKMRKDSSKMK